MRRTILTAALIVCLAATSSWAQSRTRLNVIYPAISGINAPLWYTTEQNIFQKYGLEVELIYIPTALQVTRVVLTGDSQIAFSGGAPVVSAVLSGADLVFVGGVANVPAFYMMALPEIKSVGDLKGKTVGVTRFGSSTDFALRYLVQKNGFNPDKDLNILQLGGMPELAAALSKRLIVAAPLSAPTHIRARAAGAQPLLDMAKAGVYFPAYGRYHPARLPENQPRHGIEFFPGLFRRSATVHPGQECGEEGHPEIHARHRGRHHRSDLSIRRRLRGPPALSESRGHRGDSQTEPECGSEKSQPGSIPRQQHREGSRRSRLSAPDRHAEIDEAECLIRIQEFLSPRRKGAKFREEDVTLWDKFFLNSEL